MTGRVIMCRLEHSGFIEQRITCDTMRVMAVGTFGMPVAQWPAKQGLRFGEIRIDDIVHFGAGRLVSAGNRHVPRKVEVRLDVLDLVGRIAHHRYRRMALVTGLLECGITTTLGRAETVGAFS